MVKVLTKRIEIPNHTDKELKATTQETKYTEEDTKTGMDIIQEEDITHTFIMMIGDICMMEIIME